MKDKKPNENFNRSFLRDNLHLIGFMIFVLLAGGAFIALMTISYLDHEQTSRNMQEECRDQPLMVVDYRTGICGQDLLFCDVDRCVRIQRGNKYD